MRIRTWALVSAVLMSSSAQAAAPKELCIRLRTFEIAQLPNAERRWVEFHWGYDKASLWSWGCRHSEDRVAKATCDWLVHHTNQEFSMMLPQDIMACHGYRFPKFAHYDWDKVAGAITLRGANARRVVLDLNYRDLPAGEQAVRLSAEDPNKIHELDELPPIRPMTAEASH